MDKSIKSKMPSSNSSRIPSSNSSKLPSSNSSELMQSRGRAKVAAKISDSDDKTSPILKPPSRTKAVMLSFFEKYIYSL